MARVFAPPRRLADVQGDAQILQALERAGFPAERCAADEPVSVMGEAIVLVTEFVPGERSRPDGHTFAVLGALLGRLHARTGASLRPGGAWHHLAPRGGPAEEVAAARLILEDARTGLAPRAVAGLDRLRELVDGIDGASDLPHAFVHPDFVPANAITTADGRTVVIDWTNAGRGPRIWSLGFLLWAAGARDLRLVDAVASRYRRHTELDAAELDRLPGAIRARALMIDCWSLRAGRLQLAEVARRARSDHELSHRIAERAAATLLAD